MTQASSGEETSDSESNSASAASHKSQDTVESRTQNSDASRTSQTLTHEETTRVPELFQRRQRTLQTLQTPTIYLALFVYTFF